MSRDVMMKGLWGFCWFYLWVCFGFVLFWFWVFCLLFLSFSALEVVMWWDHRTLPSLGEEKKDYNFFKKSFSKTVVKSGSLMPLACGQSPLWVWFVGKCPISEGLAPHQLCGWDQWFFLFPFRKFRLISTLKSDNPQRAKGHKNTLCEISQHSSFHMRAHCSLCLLELHLLRLWEPGPPKTPKKTLWELCQGAGAAKFSSANCGENCTDGDQHLSREN